MNTIRYALSAALVAGMCALTHTTQAATIGVAVDDFTSPTPVGIFATGGESFLPDGAIKYFIPLNAGTSGTYGVGGVGTTSDTGSAGGFLDMNLMFAPVSITESSVLKIDFDDLDLIGVNDPVGFLESIQIFDENGTAITAPITNIGGLITGNSDVQTLTLALGVLTTDPFFTRLRFLSDPSRKGTNTPEYLIAEISSVPLPAAGWMMLTGLLGLAGVGLRRRKKKVAAAV